MRSVGCSLQFWVPTRHLFESRANLDRFGFPGAAGRRDARNSPSVPYPKTDGLPLSKHAAFPPQNGLLVFAVWRNDGWLLWESYQHTNTEQAKRRIPWQTSNGGKVGTPVHFAFGRSRVLTAIHRPVIMNHILRRFFEAFHANTVTYLHNKQLLFLPHLSLSSIL